MNHHFQSPPLTAGLGQQFRGLGAATAGFRGLSVNDFEPMASLCSAVDLKLARAAFKEHASRRRLNSPIELKLAGLARKEHLSLPTFRSPLAVGLASSSMRTIGQVSGTFGGTLGLLKRGQQPAQTECAQRHQSQQAVPAEAAAKPNEIEIAERQAASLKSPDSARAMRFEARLNALTTSVLNLDDTSTELGKTSVVSTDSLDTAVHVAWRNREDLDNNSI